MPLQNVEPCKLVDGFTITQQLCSGNIAQGSAYASLLVDHYLDVRIECDGTHPNYPMLDCKRLIISQYTTTRHIGLRNNSDPNAVVIILDANQTLEEITFAEVTFGESTHLTPVLIITTKRHPHDEIEDLYWETFEGMSVPVR